MQPCYPEILTVAHPEPSQKLPINPEVGRRPSISEGSLPFCLPGRCTMDDTGPWVVSGVGYSKQTVEWSSVGRVRNDTS